MYCSNFIASMTGLYKIISVLYGKKVTFSDISDLPGARREVEPGGHPEVTRMVLSFILSSAP